MTPIIAIIGAGAMGSAVAQRLVNHGCKVVTLLDGRSAATQERARRAGIVAVSIDKIADADMILSIVPPGVARTVAEQMLPLLTATPRKPVYVDCNAVSPRTVVEIAKALEPSGCDFVDAGIIGPPPPVEANVPSINTIFYASGKAAHRFAELTRYGMNIRVMDADIGDASAVKMSFAGVTKGVTAIGTAMMLAAARAGVTEPLCRELAASCPDLLDWFGLQIPKMFPKAYRWVAEMEEIAEFTDDPAAKQMYLGIAKLYEQIAGDLNSSKQDTKSLTTVLSQSAEMRSPKT